MPANSTNSTNTPTTDKFMEHYEQLLLFHRERVKREQIVKKNVPPLTPKK